MTTHVHHQPVSPAGAREWLSDMWPSRKVSVRKVERFVAAMRDGTFDPDAPEAVVTLDPDGRLVSGQHPLRAVVEADITVTMTIRRQASSAGQRGAP
jgi:hypothetical protein